MKDHECVPTKYCICGPLSDEPDEDCPIHGCPDKKEIFRCVKCGKFMKHTNLPLEP